MKKKRPDKLMSLKEVQAMLAEHGIQRSIWTIRKWIARKPGQRKLKSIKVEGFYYCRPSWVWAFIRQQNEPATGESNSSAHPLAGPQNAAKRAELARQRLAARGWFGEKKLPRPTDNSQD